MAKPELLGEVKKLISMGKEKGFSDVRRAE